MKSLAVGLAVLVASFAYAQDRPVAQAAKGTPRTYVGRVSVERLEDGRRLRLLDDFAYFDDQGLRWDAPKGSVIDGAAIPPMVWTALGTRPLEGRYRNASIIHEIACVQKQRPWPLVHEAFYSAMLTSEVPKYGALLMYGAVYHFGPRWPTKDSEAVGEKQPPATDENFKKLEAAIQAFVAGTDLFMVDDDVMARRVREIRFAPP
jgi:hypothetical protein